MTAAEYATLPVTTQPMELIKGEVIVSPAPKNTHQRIVLAAAKLLLSLVEEHQLAGEVAISPNDVHLSADTVLQPDVFWVSAENERCQLGEDDYWHGAPDLVVEVLSPGTAVRDKTIKFELYQQHGVHEYWIVESSYMEVYTLTDGTFQRVGVYDTGQTFESPALGGHTVTLEEVF
jgi:Uma2 family endonuclease